MRSLNHWRRILYLHPKLNSDFRVSKYFNFREKCCKFWILCDITINLEVKKRGYIFPNIRSPSSMAISWSYVRSEFSLLWIKRTSHPLFCLHHPNSSDFVKTQTKKDIISFHSHLPNYLPGYLPGYPPSYPPSYLHGFWCFPIWLNTTLSYPMAIFSANDIRTFFFQFQEM